MTAKVGDIVLMRIAEGYQPYEIISISGNDCKIYWADMGLSDVLPPDVLFEPHLGDILIACPTPLGRLIHGFD